MGIGARLRAERERLGLSQEALGELAGVRKQAQLMYEKGERNPDSGYLESASVAGVDVLYVLTGQHAGGVPPAPTLTADERELLALFRAAPLGVKAAAIGALQGGSLGGLRPMKMSQSGASSQTFHGAVSGGVAGRDIIKKGGKNG